MQQMKEETHSNLAKKNYLLEPDGQPVLSSLYRCSVAWMDSKFYKLKLFMLLIPKQMQQNY